MKKTLFALVILIFSCNAFAISSLVQSKLAGNNTATGGSGLTTATATGSFTSSTTSGNLLLLVAWSTGTQINNSSTAFTASAPGFTWVNAFVSPGGIIAGTTVNATAVYYIKNAATMASSVVNTVTSANDFATTVKVEFALFEVTSIIANPYTGQNGSTSPTSGGSPGAFISSGILAASGTNLIVMTQSSVGSNISAGSGFVLGPNATVATVGQVQFYFGYPHSSSATLSFSGTETTWVAGAAVFTEVSSSVSVSRHRGSIF